jgi:hypothetical protein
MSVETKPRFRDNLHFDDTYLRLLYLPPDRPQDGWQYHWMGPNPAQLLPGVSNRKRSSDISSSLSCNRFNSRFAFSLISSCGSSRHPRCRLPVKFPEMIRFIPEFGTAAVSSVSLKNS